MHQRAVFDLVLLLEGVWSGSVSSDVTDTSLLPALSGFPCVQLVQLQVKGYQTNLTLNVCVLLEIDIPYYQIIEITSLFFCLLFIR